MSVFPVKGSKIWQFEFQIRGHRFRGSTDATNERDAKKVEKQKRAEAQRWINEAVNANRDPITLGVACDRWWSEVGRHGNDPDIERALTWLKGQIGERTPLHEIDDNTITLAITARRAMTKQSGKDEAGNPLMKPLANQTVNKTVPSLIRRVMNRAQKNWSVVIVRQPNWKEHFLPVRKRPVREISAEEDERIDQVESFEYRQLREFAEVSGLRRGEILLTWPQVDFGLRVIRIIGKGGVPATIPMSPRMEQILRGLKGHDPVHVFTFVSALTWTNPKTGKEYTKGTRYPMTYYGIGTNRKRKWARAGVDARFHDQRHTTGMRTLRATGNLKVVQTLLRHTEITTTARFYTDATVEDVREAMAQTERKNPYRNPYSDAAESSKSLKKKE